MFKNLIEFTYEEAQKTVNLLVPAGTDSQIVVNALCEFMKQIADLRLQAKAHQESNKVEEIPCLTPAE